MDGTCLTVCGTRAQHHTNRHENYKFDDEGSEWRWPLQPSAADKHPKTSGESAADGGSSFASGTTPAKRPSRDERDLARVVEWSAELADGKLGTPRPSKKRR